MKQVSAKLLAIQSELVAPKNQFNKFGQYYYRTCEDIMQAVKPLLKKNNCSLQLSDEVVLIGERYYIKTTARLIDLDTSESVINVAYAREEEFKKGMDSSQVTGASSSYARKYALNGLFLIDDVKDSDTTNTIETAKATTTQIELLKPYFEQKPNEMRDYIFAKFGARGMEDLSTQEADAILKALKKKESKK